MGPQPDLAATMKDTDAAIRYINNQEQIHALMEIVEEPVVPIK